MSFLAGYTMVAVVVLAFEWMWLVAPKWEAPAEPTEDERVAKMRDELRRARDEAEHYLRRALDAERMVGERAWDMLLQDPQRGLSATRAPDGNPLNLELAP